MKKFACSLLLLLCPLIAFAQAAAAAPATAAAPAAPKKNTITTYRIWAKDGQSAALKAALTAHAQKYHTGNWKWRVNDVISGPDSGSFQIVEGPNTWTDLEGRGDLGAEHMKDSDNLMSHVEKSSARSYMTFVEEASTTASTNWSNKSAITHYYSKPGRGPATLEILKSLKKYWEKQGYNVVVWSAYASGEPQYATVRRFKDGWKDLDLNNPTMREVFEGAYGAGSYDKLLDELNRCVDHTVSEMIEFQPALSSK